MPLLSGLENPHHSPIPSNISTSSINKEGEPARDVIIGDFVISQVILLADSLCTGYFLQIDKRLFSVKDLIAILLQRKLFILEKIIAIVKPPPTQNCHPDEGRIPSETQSHLMRVKVFLLAHNVLEKPNTFSARPRLCDLLRLFALLGSPSSKWQACECIRYFQATSHTNLSS